MIRETKSHIQNVKTVPSTRFVKCCSILLERTHGDLEAVTFVTIIDSLTWLRTMFVCCTSERSSLLTPLSGADITASTESTESQRPAAENYIPLSHYMLVTILITQKHITKVINSNNSQHHNHHKQRHTRLFTCLYVCHVITINCKKLKILKLWWSIIAQCWCPKFNENSPTTSTAAHMYAHTYTQTQTHTAWYSHKPTYFC